MFCTIFNFQTRSRAEEIVIHELNKQIKNTAGSHIQISCCCII